MLILHPARLTLGPHTFTDVESVAINRIATRSVIEIGDAGPHALFADVPEQRTTITITRRLAATHALSLLPGQTLPLSVDLSREATDAGRTRLQASCVLLESRHDLAAAIPGSGRARALHVLSLVALSPDGVADPIQLATP